MEKIDWETRTPKQHMRYTIQRVFREVALLQTYNLKQRMAYEIIKQKGPIRGPKLAKEVKVSYSTLRTHILPKLMKNDIANFGKGYFLLRVPGEPR